MTDIEIEPVVEKDIEVPALLPLLPLKETVVFPDSMTPLAIGQERSIKLIDDVVSGERMLALVTVRNEDAEEPGFDDLYEVGTAAIVHKMIRVPDGTVRVLVQGLRRVRLTERAGEDPYLVGTFADVPDEAVESREVEALTRNVQTLFGRIISLVPYLPEELQIAATNVDDPSALAHLVASTLRLKTEEKQQLLEEADVEKRLRHVSAILNREVEVLELGSKIQSQVQSEMEKGQREFFLRQQLKAIQDELGEGDPEQAELAELRERVEAAELPEEARKAADRELARLERLPSAAAEYGVIRTYLDWILSLPWGATTKDNLELRRARRILDEDHYGLDKVKERIIEYLAVSKLKNDVSGPILCFVGPPGVGKTSLGQSVARALERKFTRISVGGVRDEAEIRGHRRTYIGAMPGTIIRALRDAESLNPVFLIDEIDKMGADFRGDPSSAMLEVLDPAQNSTFRDHYLDLPFDLSKVLFICTANQRETIPGPLLDRMDVIELSGYTEEEKLRIARKYLVPRQIQAHGLEANQAVFTEKALRLVIGSYTREAGVRGLDRQLAALCRKAARQIAEGKSKRVRVDERKVRAWLGPSRVGLEPRKRTSEAGVATGLAVTSVGGDVLFVEAAGYVGTGTLTVTGQLGDVMQESARAALSWVRSHSSVLGIDPTWFETHDVHVHVPAGAVPKDGPSAGVTIATAIVSLVSGRTVSEDVAMTGEITLTGQVLPIGGVREKVLAAKRAGLTTVILPKENEPDLEELPREAQEQMHFVVADHIEQVLEAALAGVASAPLAAAGTERRAAAPR
ncbi:MAG: ATP-dependent Lon protease [Gaiellaceae bacterium]|nr:ATP-dependent Lon protease [Gaiellaceae bacterium]